MDNEYRELDLVTDPAVIARLKARAAQLGIVIGDKTKPADAAKPTPNK